MVDGVRREQGVGSYCLMGKQFQFCQMKRVMERDGGDGCTTLRMYLIPLTVYLKMVKSILCVFYHKKNFWKNLTFKASTQPSSQGM